MPYEFTHIVLAKLNKFVLSNLSTGTILFPNELGMVRVSILSSRLENTVINTPAFLGD